jgi:hypothetical protein
MLGSGAMDDRMGKIAAVLREATKTHHIVKDWADLI